MRKEEGDRLRKEEERLRKEGEERLRKEERLVQQFLHNCRNNNLNTYTHRGGGR